MDLAVQAVTMLDSCSKAVAGMDGHDRAAVDTADLGSCLAGVWMLPVDSFLVPVEGALKLLIISASRLMSQEQGEHLNHRACQMPHNTHGISAVCKQPQPVGCYEVMWQWELQTAVFACPTITIIMSPRSQYCHGVMVSPLFVCTGGELPHAQACVIYILRVAAIAQLSEAGQRKLLDKLTVAASTTIAVPQIIASLEGTCRIANNVAVLVQDAISLQNSVQHVCRYALKLC